MAESINAETAQKVARLARIELPDDAAGQMAEQLTRVLDYISQLDQVQLPKNAEPFFGAIESVNAVREDVATASFPRETILHNAPDTDGEFYRVPPVFK